MLLWKTDVCLLQILFFFFLRKALILSYLVWLTTVDDGLN